MLRAIVALALVGLGMAVPASGSTGTGTLKRDAPTIFTFTVRFTTPIDGFQLRFGPGAKILHFVAPKQFLCADDSHAPGSPPQRDRLDCRYGHIPANRKVTGWIELNRPLRKGEEALLLRLESGQLILSGRVPVPA